MRAYSSQSHLYAELEHGDFRPRMLLPAQVIGICRQGPSGTGYFSKLFTSVPLAAKLGANCREDGGFLSDIICSSFPGGTLCSEKKRIVNLAKIPRGCRKSLLGLLALTLEKDLGTVCWTYSFLEAEESPWKQDEFPSF